MNHSDFYSNLISHFPYEPTHDQKTALGSASRFIIEQAKNSVFLLKGYAGTGKTTVVSTLVNQVHLLGKKPVLLAPTGRAAKVLSSYSGKNAYTIHKKIYLLLAGQDGIVRLVLNQNKHSNTIFFVDEASMLPSGNQSGESLFSDRDLLRDLVDYVAQGKNCQLILIGDTAQLPPVGIDLSPALDNQYLSAAFGLQVISYEITEVVRQAIDSGILANATLLRKTLDKKGFEQRLRIEGYADIIQVSGEYLEDYLHKTFSGGDFSSSTVITRSNKRANLYNQEIRRRILFRDNELEAGDLLMVVKNNYYWLPADSKAGFIANGDILEIIRVNKFESMYGFQFADVIARMVDYPEEQEIKIKVLLDTLMVESASLSQPQIRNLFDEVLKDYEDISSRRKRTEQVRKNPYFNALQVKFAYALTCHKTQGGQWENIFIDLGYLKDEQADTAFFRWLYTAFTRATRKLYLVNFPDRAFA